MLQEPQPSRKIIVDGIEASVVEWWRTEAENNKLLTPWAWEPLRAVYRPSADSNGHQLQFVAAGGAAEFYVDSVALIESDLSVAAIRQARGDAALTTDYTFQPAADLTTETTAGLETRHRFRNGVYLGTEDPAGNFPQRAVNWDYRPNAQVDANGHQTRMDWSSGGKHLLGVTDALGGQTSLTYDTSDRLTQSLDAQGRKTTYTYGDANNPRLPTVIKVFDTNGTTVLRWQVYTYDTKGRTLSEQQIDPADGTTVLQEVERSYYTSGDGQGLLHTVVQRDMGGSDDVTTTYTYDPAGRVVKTQQSSHFGSCDIAYTVYDAAGNVVASLCNYAPGASPDPTDAAEAVALYDEQDPDVNRVTTHEYDALGRRVQTTMNAGASFAQTSLTVYDALDRVVRTIANFVDDGYAAPGSWVFESGVWKDGPSGATISHGTGHTENLIADTAYNDRGVVRRQRDVLGNVTLLGYDAAGRLAKTVQTASTPDYNNDYSGTSPDPDLSGYTPGLAADQDVLTEQVYDAVGNLVQTRDPLGYSHFTVYDALNRPVKTVRSAKATATIALNLGDAGYAAANDPRSASYVASPDPDRDLIQTTTYDALGRVVKTQRLLENRGAAEVWETTLYGYDPLGRQVKVVRSASNPNYDVAADPDLSGYTPSGEPDEDRITQTTHEDNGRTLYTQDELDGRTWFGYDGLGRQVKTIQGAVGTATDGGVNDPRSSSYSPSSESDEDLITRTIYNSDGRVEETVDMLGNVTHVVYDSLGRTIRTIQNYVAQGATDPADWAWVSGQWEDGSSTAIDHGTDQDENVITDTVYDAQGRVASTFDSRHNETRYTYDALGRRIQTIQNYGDGTFSAGTPDKDVIATTEYDVAGRVIATTDNAGIETRYEYDLLGRRVRTIQNYGDGVFSSAAPDEDLISETEYNRAGQVVSATDVRGTETAFTYDAAGRRRTITQAVGTALETVSYTGYDKAGRVRRMIQNWIDNLTSPDAQDGSGDWLFAPTSHGTNQDENLITEYQYDTASRRTRRIDPLGNATETAYDLGGQLVAVTDAEDVVTAFRYDQVRRRTEVVQNFVDNGEDPALWIWDGMTDDRWEESDGTAIVHGTDHDQNVIVQVSYDKAGRLLSRRDPRGNETTYTYDALGRRRSRTNPLSITWETAYSDLAGGGTRTTQTLPGVNGGSAYSVLRDFDRLGRLSAIQSGDPSSTPDVAFGYDAAGNRAVMTEYNSSGFTSPVRETTYGYDAVRRLTGVGFDTDADSTVDETVAYEYDAGGLRTKLTLPGNLEVVYTYDANGQLTGITDWDSQAAALGYDAVGRHIATERDNNFDTTYTYDAAGRLTGLTHEDVSGTPVTLADFAYTVDGRGNRTQAVEQVRRPDTTYDNHTIQYTYDNLSRLIEADYDSGDRVYNFNYDLAGNRLAELLSGTGVTPTDRYFGYNAANQLIAEGDTLDMAGDVVADFTYEYDANGNLLYKKNTVPTTLETYTWDRANRLLTALGSTSYQYDGMGNRIQQTVSSIVTNYLLDTQPGLAVVLQQTTGGNVDRFIHGPRGIHAHQDNGGDWFYPVQDGLGSVRGVADGVLAVQGMQHYEPYGTPFGAQGSLGMPFGFTGEQTDANDLVYLRARYLSPGLGVFASLDPVDTGNRYAYVSGNPVNGAVGELIFHNRYSYANGNPVNLTDHSGLCPLPGEPGSYDCYAMAQGLLSWGVNVVWDYPAGDPNICVDPAVQSTLNQSTRQRWTLNEMRAIFDAFKVFEGAYRHLGMSQVYRWPLERPVRIEKQDYVGPSAADRVALGKHSYGPPPKITMSALNWGECEQTAYTLNEQIRAWLVLHEFSHIFVKDRRPPNLEPEFYATVTLPTGIVDKFGRVIPTGYATESDQERAIEVVTATLWNNGYSRVAGFDSGAGGRTAPIDGTAIDHYKGEDFVLTNVRDIEAQGQTLEQWIIMNVILRKP